MRVLERDPSIYAEQHLDLRGRVTVAALKKIIAHGNAATLHTYCARLGSMSRRSNNSVCDWSGAQALEEGVFSGLICTPDALATLRHLPKLHSLIWHNGKMNRNHVEALARCKTLESLDLECNPIGDSGACVLARMRGLKSLEIAGSGITDVGLSKIVTLPLLERLDLWNTGVTDIGLRAISSARKLTYLSLGTPYLNRDGSHPYLSAASVDLLLHHPSLERVWLHGVVVSDAQRAALVEKLPSSKIEAPDNPW